MGGMNKEQLQERRDTLIQERQSLQNQAINLRKALEQCAANLNANEGAMQLLDQIMAECPPSSEDPSEE